jgi:hypothetical protein
MNVRLCGNAQTPRIQRSLGSGHMGIPELKAMRQVSCQWVFDSL